MNASFVVWTRPGNHWEPAGVFPTPAAAEREARSLRADGVPSCVCPKGARPSSFNFMIPLACLLVALSSLLSGCFAGETVYVDRNFTAEEEADIQYAADEWSRATGGHVHIDLAFGSAVGWNEPHKRVLLRTTRAAAQAQGLDAAGSEAGFDFIACPTCAGIGDRDFEVIGIERDQIPLSDRGHFRETLLHEFGHHVGAFHVDDPNAVMTPVFYYANKPMECLRAADLDTYVQATGEPAADMRPCSD